MAHLNTTPSKKKTKQKKLKVKKRKVSTVRNSRISNKINERKVRKQAITYEKNPVWYKRFWNWFKGLIPPFQIMLVITVIFTIFSVVSGYVQARMTKIWQSDVSKSTRYEPNSNYLVKQGAVKYLEGQLDLNSKNEVEKAVNDTAKYHGQFDSIVQSVNECKTNADLWKKLNPVVNAVKSGARYRPNLGVKPEFEIYNMATMPNFKFNNVIIVAYDSKDESQTKVINQFVKNNPQVQTLVFDVSTKGGKQAFQTPMYQFLNAGTHEKNGYDIKKNAWLGVAYGFENNQLTYHTKNINDLANLKGLPTKSLQDDTIVNNGYTPNNQDGTDNNLNEK